MKRLYPIKTMSPYITGMVGKDIRLTLRERLAILFSGGIQIKLFGKKEWDDFIRAQLGMRR